MASYWEDQQEEGADSKLFFLPGLKLEGSDKTIELKSQFPQPVSCEKCESDYSPSDKSISMARKFGSEFRAIYRAAGKKFKESNSTALPDSSKTIHDNPKSEENKLKKLEDHLISECEDLFCQLQKLGSFEHATCVLPQSTTSPRSKLSIFTLPTLASFQEEQSTSQDSSLILHVKPDINPKLPFSSDRSITKSKTCSFTGEARDSGDLMSKSFWSFASSESRKKPKRGAQSAPCDFLSSKKITSYNHSSKATPSLQAEEKPKILWGLTRVSVYSDGSRTYEVMSLGDKKPPGSKPRNLDCVFVVDTPLSSRPFSEEK